MAAEIGLLNLTQLQKITQSDQQSPPVPVTLNPSSITSSSWMWNTRQAAQDDDDSWEVKAFEEDAANILGATWPPRSYTCTFCRREFRSAQALGGHMNVHRRDRARLHQTPIGSNRPPSSSNFASPFVIPPQEFVTSGRSLCFLYSLPAPEDAVLAPTLANSCINSSSSLLPISPHVANNLASPPCPLLMNLQLNPHTTNSSVCDSCNIEHSPSEFIPEYIQDNTNSKENSPTEEIDLELRLGRRSSTP